MAFVAGDGRGEQRRLLGRQALDRHLGRGLVGLGEKNVEGGDRRTLGGELADEIGHDRARPRPLPYLLQRILVDIDDAHRQVWIEGLRGEALIGIEGDQAERLDEERIGDAKGQGPGKDGRDQDHVHPAAAQISHRCFRSRLFCRRRVSRAGAPPSTRD